MSKQHYGDHCLSDVVYAIDALQTVIDDAQPIALLDHFAGLAMQGMIQLAASNLGSALLGGGSLESVIEMFRDIPKESYNMAETMLAERAKRTEEG